MKDLDSIKEVTVTVHPHDVRLLPMTNADRIRAMTDEELAIALYAGCSGRECPEGLWDNPLTEDEEDSLCLKCTIAWLKAPVEVDND